MIMQDCRTENLNKSPTMLNKSKEKSTIHPSLLPLSLSKLHEKIILYLFIFYYLIAKLLKSFQKIKKFR